MTAADGRPAASRAAGAGARPVPAVRLSGFYLLHFAVVGCFMPFLGPWLASLGHGAVVIGTLTAVMAAGRIVAPPLWAWLADSLPRRLPLLRGCLAGETLLFAVLALMPVSLLAAGEGGAWLLAALLLGFGVCGSGVLPQFEVVTLNHLAGRTERYTVLRLWGSVGFVAAVMGLGAGVDALGIAVWPWPVLALLLAAVLLSLSLRERPAPAQVADGGSLRAALARPEVAGLLAACVLMQASHGTYYAFFSVYLEQAGYSGKAIGALWSLGVVAEVLLFLAMPWLARRVATRPLFLACFVLAVLRWLLTAAGGGSVALLVVAQCLHAASFGLYHAVAIQCVHACFRGSLQSRGQALYSSLGFGLGGAAGSFAAGLVWDAAGSTTAWLAAAAAAVAGLAVAWASGAGRLPGEARAGGPA